MKNFTYLNPTKIVFGKDEVKSIGKELYRFGAKKVLLLYGKGSIFKNGVYDTVIKSLKDKNVEFVEVSGVKPNPILSKVYEAIKIAREQEVDGILAVGGGSVIDSAKTVAAGFYYDGDVWDFFEGKAKPYKALPIFTVLTISATGSEMNSGGVITNEKENKKWAFGSPLVYPKVSIIDPTVQYSLPKNQTINGGVDAITHVFELYFDKTKNNDIMDEVSEGIIRTIMKHIPILLKDPKNYESRANLAWSATLALNKINGTGRQGGDWSSHMIEHSLSAFYDVAHGAGLAVIAPAWMKYVYKEDISKWVRFAEKIFNVCDGTDEEKALKGIDRLIGFYKKIGAPTTLKELKIKKDDLEKIADNASMLCPMGNMKQLKRDDILNILNIAWGE